MFNLFGYGTTQPLNYDIDGDGILDSYAEGIDTDGDGIVDTLALDLNGDGAFDQFVTDLDYDGDGIADGCMVDTDGDGVYDAFFFDLDHDGVAEAAQYQYDSDNNGVVDMVITEKDTDGDGLTDEVAKRYDYDQDGNDDYVERFIDTDGDGRMDTLLQMYDDDSDGNLDMVRMNLDIDGDGVADSVYEEQYVDTDGDGMADTLIRQIDSDGDGTYEALEIYDVDEDTGALTLMTLDGDLGGNGVTVDELGHFDPDSADPDDVIGDPGRAMEQWECQGNTGRCALYAQKFVIEELTGREIDIEELADLAEENGWFTEEGGTPTLNMNKVLDYYGVDNDMTFNNDMDDIVRCLGSGGKVIVSIDADEIWYGETDDMFDPTDNANHAVEVIGIDNSDPDHPMVILNDSGHEGGCGEMVPLDTFVDAWEDSGFQLIACM